LEEISKLLEENLNSVSGSYMIVTIPNQVNYKHYLIIFWVV